MHVFQNVLSCVSLWHLSMCHLLFYDHFHRCVRVDVLLTLPRLGGNTYGGDLSQGISARDLSQGISAKGQGISAKRSQPRALSQGICPKGSLRCLLDVSKYLEDVSQVSLRCLPGVSGCFQISRCLPDASQISPRYHPYALHRDVSRMCQKKTTVWGLAIMLKMQFACLPSC